MIVGVRGPAGAQRIVVVSPHHDDGILSLGASMTAWARGGAAVELLTVLGCDPRSAAPSGGWDRRGGFATEGEAASARREEDRRACAVVGAWPVWLPFGSVDYERHGEDTDVREAVLSAVADADLVLLPGHPLTHPDHAWLAGLLGDAFGRHVAVYAEQPYTRRSGAPPPGADRVAGEEGFEPVRLTAYDRIAKWRAIGCYRSQLPLLGMGRSLRRGPHRYALAPEWVAWGRSPALRTADPRAG
jgi:LmbE family N-acetylglucosaminyl deacetylase